MKKSKSEWKNLGITFSQGSYTEATHIKFAISRFLWDELRETNMNYEVLEALQKITE